MNADIWYVVLRMLSAYVGQDNFLEGVSKYLQDHRYGSTVSKDLWDSLTAVTGDHRLLSLRNLR